MGPRSALRTGSAHDGPAMTGSHTAGSHTTGSHRTADPFRTERQDVAQDHDSAQQPSTPPRSTREARAAVRAERQAARAARSPYSAIHTGPGRTLTAVYGLLAFAAIGRATYQLLLKFDEAPFAYTLSAISAAVYILATVCLVIGTRVSHHIAVAACVFEAVGVLVVGTLSFTHPEYFAHDSVWSTFGLGYGFVPLVLPFIGLWWLVRVHRRVAASATAV